MGVSSALWSACKHCAALGGAQSYAEAARVAGRRLLAARRSLGAGCGHSAAGGSSFAIVLVCVDTLGPPGFACAQASQALHLGGRARLGNAAASLLERSSQFQRVPSRARHTRLCSTASRSVKDGPAARQAGRALDVLVCLQRARTIAPTCVEIKFWTPDAIDATYPNS